MYKTIGFEVYVRTNFSNLYDSFFACESYRNQNCLHGSVSKDGVVQGSLLYLHCGTL